MKIKKEKESLSLTRDKRWWESRLKKFTNFEIDVCELIYEQIFLKKISKAQAILNVTDEVNTGRLKFHMESFSRDIFYGHKASNKKGILKKWPGKNPKENWECLKFCFENVAYKSIRANLDALKKAIEDAENSGNYVDAEKYRNLLYGQENKNIKSNAEDLVQNMDEHKKRRIESIYSRIQEFKELIEEEIRVNPEKYNNFEILKEITDEYESGFETFFSFYNERLRNSVGGLTGIGFSNMTFFLKKLGFKGNVNIKYSKIEQKSEGDPFKKFEFQTIPSEPENYEEYMEKLKFFMLFNKVKDVFLAESEDLHNNYMKVYQQISEVIEPLKFMGENLELEKTNTGLDDIQVKIDLITDLIGSHIKEQGMILMGLLSREKLREAKDARYTARKSFQLKNWRYGFLSEIYQTIDNIVLNIKGNLIQHKINESQYLSFNNDNFEIKELNEDEWNQDAKNMKEKIEKIQKSARNTKSETFFSFEHNTNWKEIAKENDSKSLSLLWNEFTSFLRDENPGEYEKFTREMYRQAIEDDKREGSSFMEYLSKDYHIKQRKV